MKLTAAGKFSRRLSNLSPSLKHYLSPSAKQMEKGKDNPFLHLQTSQKATKDCSRDDFFLV